MKKANKNKNSELSQFLRYVRGEMTKREEHAFQRKLQKDPFADEAAEGFSGISPETVEDDLLKLGRQLDNRVTRKYRFIYYRIAASVAVLMIISSVFFVLNKKVQTSDKETGEIISTPVTMEIAESQAIKEPESVSPQEFNATDEVAADSQIEPAKTVETMHVADAILEPVEDEKKEPAIILNEKAATVTPPVAEIQVDAVRMKLTDDKAAVMAEEAPQPLRKSVQPAVAGVSKAEGRASADTPPLPTGGMTSFEKYIADNIRKPSILATGDSAVAIIEFLVTTTGAIDSLIVVNSPGIEFSDEAKRLLLAGPLWIPAVITGERVNDKVRLRIIFK